MFITCLKTSESSVMMASSKDLFLRCLLSGWARSNRIKSSALDAVGKMTHINCLKLAVLVFLMSIMLKIPVAIGNK